MVQSKVLRFGIAYQVHLHLRSATEFLFVVDVKHY